MKNQITVSALKAVKAYWTWVEATSSPVEELMRHSLEGAILAYAEVLGYAVLAKECRKAGMNVPCSVEARTPGFWL